MTKLDVFRRQASVGSYVTLRLTRGEDVSGRVSELDDAHVCLDLGGRTITVFEDILAGWELHPDAPTTPAIAEQKRQPPPADQESMDADPPQTPSDLGGVQSEDHPQAADEVGHGGIGPAEGTPPPAAAGSTAAESVPDRQTLSMLAKIEAAFSEAVKRARLDPPEPDFDFPEAAFPARAVADVRREWDRARNQYAYALKVKELSRLSSVVVQILDPLVKRYPDSAAARVLLAQVLLKLGREAEARAHLGEAVGQSDAPEHWLALAAASGETTALQCYALRRYFAATAPHQAQEAWFRYLSIAVEHGDQRGLAQIMRDWSTRKDSGDNLHRFLSESLIYLTSKDDERLALQATANLVHEQGTFPNGWEEAFTRGGPCSTDLLDVERAFTPPQVVPTSAAQLVRPKAADAVPHGRIVSFGNQRFGFIDAHWGETFFFRIDDVADARLRQALLDGSWRTFGTVEFEILPSHVHQYARAVSVVPLQNAEALLQRARQLLGANQHAQSMAFVRRALTAEPNLDAARRLEEEIKKQIRDRGIGLPKGKGPYARAKRAQLVDQDLQAAENLFRAAIRERDKPESAIKDLASLLQQQGRGDDAVVLLAEHANRFRGVSPYDNMLATLYQQLGRHDEAIKLLRRLVSATRAEQQGPLLRRIAFSQFKSGKYEEAERVLRDTLENNPDDRIAERWLAGLEDARRAGSYEEASEIIGELGGLAEQGIELSSLAQSAIERCTFEGVDPARVQAGTVGLKDVAHVEELAKTLGTKRPRDRAAYYLSAAALLERDPGDTGPARIYDYLRRYFASMADAAWIEKKPADVVRSYYVESLSLVFDDSLDEAWRSLLRYLATFAPTKIDAVEEALPRGRRVSRSGYGSALQAALEMIAPVAGATWAEGLLVVGAQSSCARGRIGDAIVGSPSLQTEFARLLKADGQGGVEVGDVWQSRCREHARVQRQRLSVCRTLTKYQATAASMEDLDGQLRSASDGTTSEVDRRRLNVLRDIVEAVLGFCRASDFEERERNYWLVTTQADRFGDEVIDAPTQYSYEGLLPVCDHLRSLIEEEYAQMARTSGAELGLRLLVDQYLRDQRGELRLQVEVSNKRGCSPASSVRLCLGPGDSEYFTTDRWEREVVSTLRGGDTVVAHMLVHPKDPALADRAFPIQATAIYNNRLGEERRTADHSWTVRLYRDDEFQHIDNPYAPFAEGGPVDDAEMFVGRDDLLVRLERSLLAGSGSKSIVVFGQKRAGKSSLLEHLRRRLAAREGVVPISFSLQDIAPELSVPALLHRILHGVAEVLEELRFAGQEVPEFSPPGLDALASHATLRFHESMSTVVRDMKRRAPSFGFVLLVDEFTDVFKEIRKERIPREFMKAWKAIIEKKYFASVLVGQDIMPAFKAEFPNEFGVTEDVRVTYLDASAAAMLVQKPIGEKRFAGNAVPRLLDLTAGSPYYTMMFCARLVDYMNTTRSAIITEADILAVEEDMLRGDRRLTRDKFDNLLCAGDGAIDSGIDPNDTYAVCTAIAQGSVRGWSSRDSVRAFEASALDGLLADLERRDVVERKGTAYRLRVGLFRDWLVLQG